MRTIADFAGVWRLERTIADALDGRDGHFEGQAELRRTGADTLVHDEAGELRLAGMAPFRATRRTLWRFGAGTVHVAFEDGRPFHDFVPGVTGVGTDHPCGADLYRVHYDFSRWPDWRMRWRVQGPRKDYEMVTDYRRA